MAIKNKVQLITYPDSLGENIKTLKKVLDNYFPGLFQGGVHILPPFISSGDRGFAPITYLEIEPKFGDWDDIKEISKEYDVLLDLMVNHISRKSVYFQDFLKKGFESPYADLFITPDKVWKNGQPLEEDIAKIFLRRPKPFSTYTLKSTGQSINIWTTFGKQDPSEQIDLDINSSATKKLFIDYLTHFSRQGVKMVRLDAVGFVVKKAGTSCFFVEPEIYDFLTWLSNIAGSLGIELLPEIHAHHSIQKKLAQKGFWTYNFILPYLVLEAFICKTVDRLIKHLKSCHHKQFTMLDCHDGIPIIPDLNDLVEIRDARKVVNVCMERGANLSRIYSEKYKSENGFDVHQIRCTYYSALGCNDDAYLAARAIQLFTPGIPQIYYVGLLAGKNDEQDRRMQDGREINRHNFTLSEIEYNLKRSVVKRLRALIDFRNTYNAFNGNFWVEKTGNRQLRLGWKKDEEQCVLWVDVNTNKSEITFIDKQGEHKVLIV